MNRFWNLRYSNFEVYRGHVLGNVPEINRLDLVEDVPFQGTIGVFRFGASAESAVLASAFASVGIDCEAHPIESVRMVWPTTSMLRVQSGSRTREIAAAGIPVFLPAAGMATTVTAGHFFEIRFDRRRIAAAACDLDSDVAIGRVLDRLFLEQRLSGSVQLANHLRHLVANIETEADDIVDLAGFRAAHEQIIAYRIASILATASDPDRGRAVGRNSAALARAVDYITSHSDDRIDLSLMARHAGLSLRSLQLLFRREYDCTIVQFVQRLRLAKARERLEHKEGGMTVAQVARISGFNHLSDFARLYKDLYDETPSETLRRSMRR